MKNNIFKIEVLLLVWFAVCCVSIKAYAATEYVEGYLRYTIENESVTITGYNGRESEVTVPARIAGNPVNTIASGAFSNATTVTKVNLPDTIMTIEDGAFSVEQTVTYNYNADNPIDTYPEVPGTQDQQGNQGQSGNQNQQGNQDQSGNQNQQGNQDNSLKLNQSETQEKTSVDDTGREYTNDGNNMNTSEEIPIPDDNVEEVDIDYEDKDDITEGISGSVITVDNGGNIASDDNSAKASDYNSAKAADDNSAKVTDDNSATATDVGVSDAQTTSKTEGNINYMIVIISIIAICSIVAGIIVKVRHDDVGR